MIGRRLCENKVFPKQLKQLHSASCPDALFAILNQRQWIVTRSATNQTSQNEIVKIILVSESFEPWALFLFDGHYNPRKVEIERPFNRTSNKMSYGSS